MFKVLLILFVVIPFIEVSLLIKVGSIIGTWPTIGLVIFTAVLGSALMRIQGLKTLMRVQKTLASGQLPTMELLEGAIILVSGALLLTPGFLTDCIGFFGLIPFTRRVLVRWILARGLPSQGKERVRPDQSQPPHVPFTIEGEYRREPEDK